jgi:hypothetical protein
MKTDIHYALRSIYIEDHKTYYKVGDLYKGNSITHIRAKSDCLEPIITVNINGVNENYYL